jgi:hypothetical protein
MEGEAHEKYIFFFKVYFGVVHHCMGYVIIRSSDYPDNSLEE